MNKAKKYIKVTDNDGKSSVVPAGSECFFKSQKYKISDPTNEEIEAFYPTKTTGGSSISDNIKELSEAFRSEKAAHTETSKILESEQNAHKAAVNKLSEERAEHVTTRNQLIAEQGEHKKTKDAFIALESGYKKAQTSLSEATSRIEKLNAELAKLKTGNK